MSDIMLNIDTMQKIETKHYTTVSFTAHNLAGYMIIRKLDHKLMDKHGFAYGHNSVRMAETWAWKRIKHYESQIIIPQNMLKYQLLRVYNWFTSEPQPRKTKED